MKSAFPLPFIGKLRQFVFNSITKAIKWMILLSVFSSSILLEAQTKLRGDGRTVVPNDSKNLSQEDFLEEYTKLAIEFIKAGVSGSENKEIEKLILKGSYRELAEFIYTQFHKGFEPTMREVLSTKEWEIYHQVKLIADTSIVGDILKTNIHGIPTFVYNQDFVFDLVSFLAESDIPAKSDRWYLGAICRDYKRIDNKMVILDPKIMPMFAPDKDPVAFVSFFVGELQRDMIFAELHELYHILPENATRTGSPIDIEIAADRFALDKSRLILENSLSLYPHKPFTRNPRLSNRFEKKKLIAMQLASIQVFNYLISRKWEMLIEKSKLASIEDLQKRWEALLNYVLSYAGCGESKPSRVCQHINKQKDYITSKASRMKIQVRDYVLLDPSKHNYIFKSKGEQYNFLYNARYYVAKKDFQNAVNFLENNLPKMQNPAYKIYGELLLAKLYWSFSKNQSPARRIYQSVKKIRPVYADLCSRMLYLMDFEMAKNIKAPASISDANIIQVQKIWAVNDGSPTRFGAAVAVADNVIMIGSPSAGKDCNLTALQQSCYGAVHVFILEGNVWKGKYEINSPSGEKEGFGNAIAINGGYAIVGASAQKQDKGAAYVLRLESGKWVTDRVLHGSETTPKARFGESVSIFCNTIAIGAPDANSEKGLVFIFEKAGNGWREKQIIRAPVEKSGVRFGRSVSLYGDMMAVGTIYDNDNGSKSGSVSLFYLKNDKWVFSRKIVPTHGRSDDRFGISVSLFKHHLLVGAVFDGSKCSECGSAYFFEIGKKNEIFETKVTAADLTIGAGFGSSVAIFNNFAVIGAERHNGSGFNAGKAYLYHFDEKGKKWKEAGGINGSSLSENNYFGKVGIFNNIIVVGADYGFGLRQSSGCAYLFDIK